VLAPGWQLRPRATVVVRFLGALALHTAAIVYVTWPLAAHLGTHVGCPTPACHFDLRVAYWAQAWEVHALTTAPLSVLDAPIFHPAKHTLLFLVLGLGSLPIFAPVYLVTGNPTLAGNVAWLGAVALTAAALHVAVRSWSGLESAGAVAGLTFLTARWVYWDWIPVAPTYAAWQYLPAIVWLLARPSLGIGAASLLGILLALQCSTDLVYCALPVLAPPALVALWRLAHRTTRREGLRILGALGLAILLLLPLVAGYLHIRAENPNLLNQSFWSTRVRGATALPRDLVGGHSPTSIAPAAAVLLVLGMGAAFVAGPVRPRAWRQALLWIAIGTGLSLGPTIVVGDWTLPNHVDRLARAALPMLAAIRQPKRMRVVALVGLCLLAGLAFATCIRAVERKWPAARRSAPLLALAMAVALYLSARVGWPGLPTGPHVLALAPPVDGYPLSPAIGPNDPLVVALRRGQGPVLELPAVANVSGVTSQARAMYTALWHWRPVLNGYASYWPFGFAMRMAIAQRLPDPEALRILRDKTGLATIVVHLDELEHAQRAAWEAALVAPRDDFVSTQRVDRLVVMIEVAPAAPPPKAPVGG
jgi:hypothetical protein